MRGSSPSSLISRPGRTNWSARMCLSWSQSQPHFRKLADLTNTTRLWASWLLPSPTPRALRRKLATCAFWLGLWRMRPLPAGRVLWAGHPSGMGGIAVPWSEARYVMAVPSSARRITSGMQVGPS